MISFSRRVVSDQCSASSIADQPAIESASAVSEVVVNSGHADEMDVTGRHATDTHHLSDRLMRKSDSHFQAAQRLFVDGCDQSAIVDESRAAANAVVNAKDQHGLFPIRVPHLL